MVKKQLDELVILISGSDINEVNVYYLLKVVKERFPKVVEGFEDLIKKRGESHFIPLLKLLPLPRRSSQ